MSSLRSLVDRALRGGHGQLEALVRIRTEPSIDHAAWARFLADYMRKAADTAEALAAAVSGHPLEQRVRPFLDHITSYVDEVNDAVPDNAGTMGALDDAYVVMVTIETLRELMSQPADKNLVAANAVCGMMLGESVHTRIRELVDAIKQRVIVETLRDLPGLIALIGGAAAGNSVALDIPTPVFTFPQERKGAAPTGADAARPASPVTGAAAKLVGAWQYTSMYTSSGFSATTYLLRFFTADRRFSERARSTASLAHTADDGSWGGETSVHSSARPDERGRWTFIASVLTLTYDDGSVGNWNVTFSGNSYLTVPVGGGERRLWERVG